MTPGEFAEAPTALGPWADPVIGAGTAPGRRFPHCVSCKAEAPPSPRPRFLGPSPLHSPAPPILAHFRPPPLPLSCKEDSAEARNNSRHLVCVLACGGVGGGESERDRARVGQAGRPAECELREQGVRGVPGRRAAAATETVVGGPGRKG